MIDALSDRITLLIKNNVAGMTEEKEELVSYGLKLIIYEIFILAFIFSLSAFLGIVKYTLIYFVVFGGLRIYAGGAHASSRLECFISYSLSLFGTIYLSKYLWAGSLYPAILVFVISFVIVYVYAPGDTTEKPILSNKMKRRQKFISLLLISVVFAMSIITWHFDTIAYNLMLIASIQVVYLLSPLGYLISKCKRSCDVQA